MDEPGMQASGPIETPRNAAAAFVTSRSSSQPIYRWYNAVMPCCPDKGSLEVSLEVMGALSCCFIADQVGCLHGTLLTSYSSHFQAALAGLAALHVSHLDHQEGQACPSYLCCFMRKNFCSLDSMPLGLLYPPQPR